MGCLAMQYNTCTKAMINFVTKDKTADVVGYLNLPPCKNNDKQYPIFIKDGELYAYYKGGQINIHDNLTLDDKIRADSVLIWNDWSYQPSHVVISLMDWKHILL